MKVLVCVKRVVDPNLVVRVRAGSMDLASARRTLNPFDEVAVEAAVQLREAGLANEVVALSVGPSECREVLRTAMAIGADRGLLVETDAEVEPLMAAKTLAALVRREQPQLVLTGRQSTDHDYGQTGPMLAALLGWAQATCVSRLALRDGVLDLDCEAEDGCVHLQVPLPAVVSVDLRLNTPRYASLPAVIKAKRKPLDAEPLAALGIADIARVAWLQVREPTQRGAVRLAADARELVAALNPLREGP